MTKLDPPCGAAQDLPAIDPTQVVPMSSVYCEARRLARKEYKAELRRQGIRPDAVPDLPTRAASYFEANKAELLAKAKTRLTHLQR
jgi:hypothetical protein